MVAGEDKPWPRDGLVPAAPTGAAVPARPSDRKPPLALILGVLLALLLLALVLARG